MNTAARTSLVLITCALVLSPIVVVRAQLGTEWVARYNGPGNGSDRSQDLAVDDSGNVYVTGYSRVTGSNFDYATIKYSSLGDTAWVRGYNGPANTNDFATALTLGYGGNAYVTGYSFGIGTDLDYATIRYTTLGDTIWVRRYNGPGVGNANDIPSALAVDDSGYVYVTGTSFGIGTDRDIATIRYSPLGDTLWVRRYNGPGNDFDASLGLAVDRDGNTYVTGYSRASSTEFDYATLKYSPDGDTLWVRRYNGPGDSTDVARALAIDDSGNIYVTGWSWSSSTNFDYATIKYSPDGDTLWVRRYNGPGNSSDQAQALAVDVSGNVYVTGWSWGSGTDADYATIKYSPDGDTIWVERYNGPGDSTDEARALAVDDSGNVSVAGRSWGGATDMDFATIQYSTDGDLLWIRRYNGPGNKVDEAWALAVDNGGIVYATGSSHGIDSETFPEDYATIKYSNPTGDVNCDGIFDLSDVVLLGNFIDGLIDLTGTCGGGQADVDGDGDIDQDDYELLYDVVAGEGS